MLRYEKHLAAAAAHDPAKAAIVQGGVRTSYASRRLRPPAEAGPKSEAPAVLSEPINVIELTTLCCTRTSPLPERRWAR